MSSCPLPVGEWLIFEKDTCFGTKYQHLGIIIAADDNELVAISVNATSQISHIEQFAINHGASPEKSIVKILPSSSEAGLHFSKPTAFDCNRVQRINYEQLQTWRDCKKVHPVSYNNNVSPTLLAHIKDKTLASGMIDEHTKRIVRNS